MKISKNLKVKGFQSERYKFFFRIIAPNAATMMPKKMPKGKSGYAQIALYIKTAIHIDP